MESRDIPRYSSPAKTYNTPVSRTSNLSAKASVNPNKQLPQFDPFKPAEYVLNNLGPAPGEERIYSKFFKKNTQKTPVTESKTDGVRSSSLSNYKSVEEVIVISDDENDYPIDDKDDDKPIDGKDYDKPIDGKDYDKPIDDKDDDKPKDGKVDDKPKDGKDDDKPKDGKDDDKPKDGKDDDYNVDRDKLLRLYSHKLHIRKPRIPYSRISLDDSGILSDTDEFA
ncbi:19478_t:CDS:2 [Dentiscutata erythropus]|uniref:19478_t:CDS:1 n=1 Tax=Dentiscutata erythropus TaxID=1348616 RepID=A0A9N8ZM34_9GLOM|nr:19478_t:CDS:2 [Dentiscutata erythropus]